MKIIPIQVEIYGEPGVGKTHFLYSASKPYAIDLSPTAEGRVNALMLSVSMERYEHCVNLSEVGKAITNARDSEDQRWMAGVNFNFIS